MPLPDWVGHGWRWLRRLLAALLLAGVVTYLIGGWLRADDDPDERTQMTIREGWPLLRPTWHYAAVLVAILLLLLLALGLAVARRQASRSGWREQVRAQVQILRHELAIRRRPPPKGTEPQADTIAAAVLRHLCAAGTPRPSCERACQGPSAAPPTPRQYASATRSRTPATPRSAASATSSTRRRLPCGRSLSCCASSAPASRTQSRSASPRRTPPRPPPPPHRQRQPPDQPQPPPSRSRRPPGGSAPSARRRSNRPPPATRPGDLPAPGDVSLTALFGLLGGALSGAFAIRNLQGTSTPYSVPVALSLLKLPSGALTAIVGILLVRGEFIPGLSQLDNQPQILAYAFVFGVAQQVATRYVDARGQQILSTIPSKAAGDRTKGSTADPEEAPEPPPLTTSAEGAEQGPQRRFRRSRP